MADIDDEDFNGSDPPGVSHSLEEILRDTP